MLRYILRRIVHLVPVLFVVSIVIFSITLLLPGDPTLAILGDQASQAERLAMRQKMGLDRPIILQYLTWLGSAFTGDFGRSLRTQEPVASVCVPPPVTDRFAPDTQRGETLGRRHRQFQHLYAALRADMQPPSDQE